VTDAYTADVTEPEEEEVELAAGATQRTDDDGVVWTDFAPVDNSDPYPDCDCEVCEERRA